MGWTFGREWSSKEALVDYLTTRSMGGCAKVLTHTVRGQTLWAVVEYVQDTEHYKAGKRFIYCALLSCSHGEWGYKDMDESMGPCETSCPLKYFDMVPDPGGYATEWRKRVRDAAAHKANQRKIKDEVKPGDILVLKPGCSPAKVRVLQANPLVGEADGRVYRIVPRHIDHIENFGN